jgi:hypothetical protein
MRDLAPHVAGWLELVGSLDGDARSKREGGVTWSLTDIPWPMFNAGVAEAGADVGVVEAALAELVASGLPWFWFALPQTPRSVVERVAASGAVAFDERAPWMEAERAALPAPAPPDGVSVVEATDDESVREWALTLQAAYGFPDAGRDSWISAGLRRDIARPQFRLWTVVSAGRPVAVTLGFVSDGIVAQFGVGVLDEQRGKGYGRLVTLVPPAELEAPVAGHWATPDGERLYGRLGMRTDGWVTRYLGGMAEIPDTAAGGHTR